MTICGEPFALSAGEFCFINSGELHEVKSTGESLHHAIVFHPDFLDFALYDTCQHNFIRPITSGALLLPTSCPGLLPESRRQLFSHLQEIVMLSHSPSACAPFCMKLHILQVIALLYQENCLVENTLTAKGKDSLQKLKQVIAYIHQNYQEPIPLQALSDICYMSPNYFCRYFKQEIGKTPIGFLNEYRMEKACQLLSESQLTISDIALSVGFDNFSYFIRKFREYKGVTPKKYRSLCLRQ